MLFVRESVCCKSRRILLVNCACCTEMNVADKGLHRINCAADIKAN